MALKLIQIVLPRHQGILKYGMLRKMRDADFLRALGENPSVNDDHESQLVGMRCTDQTHLQPGGERVKTGILMRVLQLGVTSRGRGELCATCRDSCLAALAKKG